MDATNGWNVSVEAAELHEQALVWDAIFPFFDYYLFSSTLDGAQAGKFDPKYETLQEYAAAGCNVVGLTISGSLTDVPVTMRIIAGNLGFLRSRSDDYLLAETHADLIRAPREGKMAVVFNFQGSDSLAGNTDLVEVYYRLGVRQMLLCYNVRNAAGSGCHERSDDGLSNFGIRVVREMNRVGMIVDASHTGYRTTMDIFDTSASPVIFSHSNPAALTEHPRNIRDDQIKRCAESGGVVGVVGFDDFLPGKQATVDALAQAIDYIVQLVGPDHVGLGLDWVYCEEMFRTVLDLNKSAYPSGEDGADYETAGNFLTPSAIPLITQALLDRGYAGDDVRKILGENWSRVAREVWK